MLLAIYAGALRVVDAIVCYVLRHLLRNFDLRVARESHAKLGDDLLEHVVSFMTSEDLVCDANRVNHAWFTAIQLRKDKQKLRLFAVGGYLGAYNEANSVIERYDLTRGTWHSLDVNLTQTPSDEAVDRVPNVTFACVVGKRLCALSVHEEAHGFFPDKYLRMRVYDTVDHQVLYISPKTAKVRAGSPVTICAATSDGTTIYVLSLQDVDPEVNIGSMDAMCVMTYDIGHEDPPGFPFHLLSDSAVFLGRDFQWTSAKMTMAYDYGKLYVVVDKGAHFGDGGTTEIHVLHLQDLSWHEIVMPHSRSRAGVCTYRGLLIFAGGFLPIDMRVGDDEDDDHTRCNLVEGYCTQSDEWITLPPMHEARRDASVVEAFGSLWVIGGAEMRVEGMRGIETWCQVERYNEASSIPWTRCGQHFSSHKFNVSAVSC